MSLWQTVTWDVARAGGFTAYLLLALSVALGLALSAKLQSPSKWPRLINNELHNFLTLLALIFTGIHLLAVWVDPFTRFSWNEVFIPFASHYRTLWMVPGIVGLYLGLAIGLSTWIRPLIGYTWWRRLHYLTLAIYVLVTLHGIMTGSDTQTLWGFAIYAGSVLLIGGLLCRRALIARKADRKPQARPAARKIPQRSPNNAIGTTTPEWKNGTGRSYAGGTRNVAMQREPLEKALRR